MKKRFRVIYVEITDKCNLSCFFCPVNRKKADGESFRLIEPDFFDDICSQICDFTDKMTYHVLGEPLVIENLSDYLDISLKYGIGVIITTNGLLLDKMFQKLVHPAVGLINISVTSIIGNKDIDVRKYFSDIMDFCLRFHKYRPDIFINLRLWNYKTENICDNLNREFIDLINDYHGTEIPYSIPLTGRKSRKVNDFIFLNFDSEFIFPDKDALEIGSNGRCHGLGNHIGILSDGTVIPCCLDYSGSISLGNLKKESLSVILKKERALNMINGFRKHKLVEDTCKRCGFIKRFRID